MAHEVHPTLRPYHARIYEAIREAHWFFGEAPSQQELQHACQCSGTTVQQAIKELRKRGLVTATKFAARSLRPTDLERTVSTEPLDPWAELADTGKSKYWIVPEQNVS